MYVTSMFHVCSYTFEVRTYKPRDLQSCAALFCYPCYLCFFTRKTTHRSTPPGWGDEEMNAAKKLMMISMKRGNASSAPKALSSHWALGHPNQLKEEVHVGPAWKIKSTKQAQDPDSRQISRKNVLLHLCFTSILSTWRSGHFDLGFRVQGPPLCWSTSSKGQYILLQHETNGPVLTPTLIKHENHWWVVGSV